jgi:hypothetical protein
MQEAFSPRQLVFDKIHFWWMPIGLALLGALIGFGIFSTAKPVYEAEAEIHVAVDFSKIGLVTDIEQDQFIELVGDLIKSSLVVNQVSEQIPSVASETFWQIASLERRNMQWVLKIRHADPSIAGEIVSTWQKVAFETINGSHEHALVASSLSDYLDTLTGCLEQSVPQVPSNTACDSFSVQELQSQLAQTSAYIQDELALSNGINPAISVSAFSESGSVPYRVTGSRSWYLFSGGSIGFVLGIWIISFIQNKKTMKLISIK